MFHLHNAPVVYVVSLLVTSDFEGRFEMLGLGTGCERSRGCRQLVLCPSAPRLPSLGGMRSVR